MWEWRISLNGMTQVGVAAEMWDIEMFKTQNTMDYQAGTQYSVPRAFISEMNIVESSVER